MNRRTGTDAPAPSRYRLFRIGCRREMTDGCRNVGRREWNARLILHMLAVLPARAVLCSK
ncbi:hypothetical protein C4998_02380 [Neisseria gonorrhoeae]